MNWPTKPFTAVVSDVSAGSTKIQQADYQDTGLYPVIDQGSNQVAGYTDDQQCLSRADLPVLVFGDHTRRFKFVDTPFAVGADGVKLLRPVHDELDAKFAFHFLRTAHIPNAGYSRHFKFLKEVQIPLPPLPEQRRIAAILDQADELRAKRRRALTLLDELVPAVFTSMFPSDRAIPHRTIGETVKTTSGGTPSRRESGNFGGDIPWVKSGEVAQGLVTKTEESITEQGLRDSSAKLMPVGTVLVAMYGATAGEVGELGIAAATNQAVCCIDPGITYTTKFLVESLKAKKRELKTMAIGGAQPNLSQSHIRALSLPTPEIDKQRFFSRLTENIDGLKSDHCAHLKKLDELFASLQHRAFNGEL